MILKKRIIAYILAFSGLISTNAFAFLEDVDDVPEINIMAEDSTAGEFSGENVLNAYRLLRYIGSVVETEEAFEENIKVTKAYAAQALAVIASGSTVENAFTDVFSDVPENHEYMTGIAQALNKGIIDASDKFYPNKNISAEELADMALRALKYDYIYSDESALSRATDIGLFKGVKYSQDEITVGQFMLFLKNVLDTDYIKMSGLDNQGGATVEIVSGVSHLEKYFDIYKQDGILTGYKYSSINGDADFDNGTVEINRGFFKLNSEISMDYVKAMEITKEIDGLNNELEQLSGSRLTMDRAVYNFAVHTGAGVTDLFKMASATPAKAIGVYDSVGSVEVGKNADLVFLDDALNLKKVIFRGKII